jgi:hypothetical protein
MPKEVNLHMPIEFSRRGHMAKMSAFPPLLRYPAPPELWNVVRMVLLDLHVSLRQGSTRWEAPAVAQPPLLMRRKPLEHQSTLR